MAQDTIYLGELIMLLENSVYSAVVEYIFLQIAIKLSQLI